MLYSSSVSDLLRYIKTPRHETVTNLNLRIHSAQLFTGDFIGFVVVQLMRRVSLKAILVIISSFQRWRVTQQIQNVYVGAVC